jgi:hypothetical protein
LPFAALLLMLAWSVSRAEVLGFETHHFTPGHIAVRAVTSLRREVQHRFPAMDIEILARLTAVDWEPYVLHPELGEFHPTEEDEIELRERGMVSSAAGLRDRMVHYTNYVIAWFTTPIS